MCWIHSLDLSSCSHHHTKDFTMPRNRVPTGRPKGRPSGKKRSTPLELITERRRRGHTQINAGEFTDHNYSSSIPEPNIYDLLIIRSNEYMLSGSENVESAVLQNSDHALETNIEDRLITGSKESEIFQCKKEESVENIGEKIPNKSPPKKHKKPKEARPKKQSVRHRRKALTKPKGKSSHESLLIPSDVSNQCVEHTTTSLGSSDAAVTTEKDNLTSPLEQYMVVDNNSGVMLDTPAPSMSAFPSSHHTSTIHMDLLVPSHPEPYLTKDPSSNSASFQLQNSKKYVRTKELGARSSAADQSFRPFTAIKQETPDPEFVSVSEEIPVTKFVSAPQEIAVTECPNPKCMESVSQLKKKVTGLELKLRESLRRSGEMSLRVQSALEEKAMLENRLNIAEIEISCFKEKNRCYMISLGGR